MQDGANQPATVQAPPREATSPLLRRTDVLLLGIGVGVGLAIGILLTLGVTVAYTFVAHTLPETRDSVQVFNEVNALRQQLNALNEEKQLQEQEKEAAVRQALSAVASTTRAVESGKPGVVPPARHPGGGPEAPRVVKVHDPFAEVDAEVKKLEQTQKVLNTLLDILSPKRTEPIKEH